MLPSGFPQFRYACYLQPISRFVTSFSIPYLLNEPYAALGSKVGFIFGSAAVLAGIYAYLCVPECRHRTLEEIDELFRSGIPVRHFSKIKEVRVGGGQSNDAKLDDDENGNENENVTGTSS